MPQKIHLLNTKNRPAVGRISILAELGLRPIQAEPVQFSVMSMESSGSQLPKDTPNPGDIDAGRQALNAGNLELADLLLSRALANNPKDIECVRLLVNVAKSQAKQRLTAEDHRGATDRLAAASRVIGQSMKAGFGEMTPAQMQQILDIQKTIDDLQRTVNDSATELSRNRIAIADRLAQDGHRYYWSNSRDHVRWALTNLCWVKGRFDLIDASTQGEYFRVLNKLKDMVSDKEWAPLMAMVGFVEKGA
jgi:hypothetical protein